jgi:hypothetical protein
MSKKAVDGVLKKMVKIEEQAEQQGYVSDAFMDGIGMPKGAYQHQEEAEGKPGKDVRTLNRRRAMWLNHEQVNNHQPPHHHTTTLPQHTTTYHHRD